MRLCAALAAVQIMAVCLVPQYEGTRFKRIAYGDRNVSSLWRSIVVQLQHVGSHSNVHMCGGTLVSSDLVLTAAHCLSGKEELRLKFTSNDPLCVNDTGKFVAVMPLIHRSFTDMTWLSVTTHRPLRRSKIFFNDIAALQLKSTIDCLTNVIPPTVISMTTSKFITNETLCHVVGWGATEGIPTDRHLRRSLGDGIFAGNIRPRSPVLKKAKVQLLPEETCSTAYGLDFSALPSELLCATDPTHQGLDACEVVPTLFCIIT